MCWPWPEEIVPVHEALRGLEGIAVLEEKGPDEAPEWWSFVQQPAERVVETP